MGEPVGSVDVSFHGVRGSTPCSCPTVQRYGGNTSCVSVESEGHDPIVMADPDGNEFCVIQSVYTQD